MTMPQLIDQDRFNPAVTLWTGDGPSGERLDEYVAEEVKHEAHHGETPIGVSDETLTNSQRALEAAKAAAPYVTKNKDEYERVVNDMAAISLLMQYYNAKVKAAEQVLLYGYDHDMAHLKNAEPFLARSVDLFKQLTDVAGPAYITATSIETSQRRIPFPGRRTTQAGAVLPMYEKELATFKKRIAELNVGATVNEIRVRRDSHR